MVLGLAVALAAVRMAGCNGVRCCPIQTPSCDCFDYGGSATANNMCPAICDVPPPNWKQGTDDNGCPILIMDPHGGSCLPPPPHDAGGDAADADAGDGGAEKD
jgi:hypothetical protein